MNAKVSALMSVRQTKDWTDYSTGVAWGTVALFAGVLIGYIGMIAAIYMGAMSLPVGTVVATVLLYLGFTVVHEAGHGNIAHEVTWMKPVERLLGWSSTLLFLMIPFGLFAKIHDYHHAFTNDPDRDPDHWVSGNSWRDASVRALLLPLNYMYLTATRFKHDPVIAQTHKSSIVYYIITISIVGGLALSGYVLEVVMIGIVPAFLASYVLGMLFDWIPHKPTRLQGRYQNTRSYMFPGFKYLTLGQNYHHIHHLYPRVSWYNYEPVFKLVRPELEANNAPIEKLFSRRLPGFGKSIYALEPSSVDGINKITLKVEKVHQETADSVAITFENMNGKTLPFKAGQYVTVTKRLKGEAVTRCYSICESPNAGKLTIGVKQVENGQLSTYLTTVLAVGDELTVAGPFGRFTFDPNASVPPKLLTLIAGGSGITPILSIAKTALESCAETSVHLIYANRCITSVMFFRQLNELTVKYPERFSLTSIYGQSHKGWAGETGYLNEEKLIKLLAIHEETDDGQYYVCGPDKMKEVVITTLRGLDIKSEQIFVEAFSQDMPKPYGALHKVNIALANGTTHEVDVAENQTVLQAALHEGINIPHACGVGQCGCCMMQITEGIGEMGANETPGILPGELAKGLTLACQCRPKSALSLQPCES